MKKAKLLLVPFALPVALYGVFKRWLYSSGILKAYSSSVATVGVGNLSMGGTGKTPISALILKELMLDGYRMAYLSRGYGRKVPGLRLVGTESTTDEVGDEALQVKRSMPSAEVWVSEDRAIGLKQIEKDNKCDIAVLDDCFQHLRVEKNFMVLLTTFDEPYSQQYVFPAGFLREPRKFASKADVVIVTKCPEDLSELDAEKIKRELKFSGKVFFTTTKYSEYLEPVFSGSPITTEDLKGSSVVLVTGIAKPQPLKNKVEEWTEGSITHMAFRDHYNFKPADLEQIASLFDAESTQYFLTTSKDATRLRTHASAHLLKHLPLYTCPIEAEFLFDQKQVFKQTLLSHVDTNTGVS